jgi:hypothetical protein
MLDEISKSHANKIAEIANLKYDKFYAWYKQILLMASGLLSVLVALHSKNSETYIEHLAFITTIVSLSLGILSGSIFLFSESHNLKKVQEDFSDKAIKYLNDKNQANFVVTVQTSKIFVFCERLSYISFLVALIAMCYYAILSDCAI